MGEAMLRAAFAQGVLAPEDVVAAEVSEARRDYIASTYPVKTTADPAEAALGTDLIVFAVKPQEFDRAAKTLTGKLKPEQTAVSIMAGVRIDKISRSLGHAGIARVMPSTPAAIGEGASVWTTTPEVSETARNQIGAILSAMGSQIYVNIEDEKYVDMATALSGSGPGFVFLMMEAFIDAGVHIGFRREVAEQLALQTFAGSAKYAQARGVHLAQLRNEVTSPAGTTAAGLQVLEDAGLRGVIMGAVEAAYERSRELGES
jgi:pyrroline-5-carboxylate reductase